jgi:hypothetical protein
VIGRMEGRINWTDVWIPGESNYVKSFITLTPTLVTIPYYSILSQSDIAVSRNINERGHLLWKENRHLLRITYIRVYPTLNRTLKTTKKQAVWRVTFRCWGVA